AQPAGGLFLQPLRHHVRGAREDPPRASVQAAADPGEPGCARHQNRVMNKTLLLIMCDFLLLNLLALTRWEKAEPPSQQKVTAVKQAEASAPAINADMLELMRVSLEDEKSSREQLAAQLNTTKTTLTEREQNLAYVAQQKSQLEGALTTTTANVKELEKKYSSATNEAFLTKEQ